MLEYADFVRSSGGAGLATETVGRVRGACNWLEGLLPHLLPAVEQLLAKAGKQPLRVGAVAVEVLMHVHCRFPHAAAQRQQQQVVVLTEWLTTLYTSAHSPDAPDTSSPPPRSALQSVPSGPLPEHSAPAPCCAYAQRRAERGAWAWMVGKRGRQLRARFHRRAPAFLPPP